MMYNKQIIAVDYGKYSNNVSIYEVNNAEFVLLFVPGGNRPGSFPTQHIVPWWTNQQVTVAVFELADSFEKHGMPAKFRSSQARRAMLLAAIGSLSTRYPGKNIVCFGHSFGSIEASWVATGPTSLVTKVIISNGTWAPSTDSNILYKDGTIGDFGKTAVPTLILHHKNDQTEMCPYAMAQTHMQAHSGITVTNGYPHTGDPGTEPGPHFYTGQEAEVFKNVKLWIQDNLYENFIG